MKQYIVKNKTNTLFLGFSPKQAKYILTDREDWKVIFTTIMDAQKHLNSFVKSRTTLNTDTLDVIKYNNTQCKLKFTVEQIVAKDSKVKISAVGTGCCIELPGLTNKRVKELFGKIPYGTTKFFYSKNIVFTCNKEKMKPLKDGDVFSTGIYTLYTANGIWRIGGGNVNYVSALADMLLGNVKPNFVFANK